MQAEKEVAECNSEIVVTNNSVKSVGLPMSSSKGNVKDSETSDKSLALPEREVKEDSEEEDTFEQWLDRAEQGDAEAQEAVAMKYENDKQYAKAFYWYQKAAAAGCAMAQYRLARMYHQGLATNQSTADAFQWYSRAAEQGHSPSRLHIGEMYEFGKGGVDKCLQKASQLYKEVIADTCLDRKDPIIVRAQCNLALMFRSNGDYKHDFQNILLLSKAADIGYVRAMHEIGMYYTSSGKRWEYQRGLSWLLKAAERDYNPSLYSLGCAYWEGKVVQRHLPSAMKYWTKAAEQSHSEAAYHLGNLFAENGSEMQSLKMAAKWWLKAATQGHADAQYQIATLHESGAYSRAGVKQSLEDASQWFRKAADQGHILSQQKLEQSTLIA